VRISTCNILTFNGFSDSDSDILKPKWLLATVAQTEPTDTGEILGLSFFGFFGFAIAVLLSFRHGRSPSIHIGSREADMARSRQRERTRTNKNAPSLHARSRACYAPGM
jgi:hypothetical protein